MLRTGSLYMFVLFAFFFPVHLKDLEGTPSSYQGNLASYSTLGFLSQFWFTLNNTSWHRGRQRLACSHAEFKVANVHGIRHISAGKRALTPLQMSRSHHESDFECPAFITYSSRMYLELFIGSRVARKKHKEKYTKNIRNLCVKMC